MTKISILSNAYGYQDFSRFILAMQDAGIKCRMQDKNSAGYDKPFLITLIKCRMQEES